MKENVNAAAMVASANKAATTKKQRDTAAAIKGLAAKRSECLADELKRQARCLEDADALPTDDAKAAAAAGCALLLAKQAKEKALAAYDKAERAYLLMDCTDYSEHQARVLTAAAMDFADSKADGLAFLVWFRDNDRSHAGDIVDTAVRLERFINAAYRDYIKGRKDAAAEKAAKEAAKARQADALDALADAESIDEMIRRLTEKKAALAAAK